MRLNEWNARLHGLVVFRSLLDDAVVAKLVDLTDRMASGTPGCSAVCDAVAQFEAVQETNRRLTKGRFIV